MKPSKGRAAGSLAALLLSVALLTTAAGATTRGDAGGTTGVTTATWAAIPTQSATPSPSSLTLTFSISLLSVAPQYFDVVNNGTKTLSATAYFVALSGLSLPGPTLTLKACPIGVSWNQSGGGSCATGSPTTIASFTMSSSSYVDSAVAPTTAGTRLHVQASVSNVLVNGTLTAVVNAEVSSLTPRDFAVTTSNH